MRRDPGRDRLLRRSRHAWERRNRAALVASLGPLPAAGLEAEPALGYFLADALHRLGERDRALDLVRRPAPAFARRGNDRLARERLNLEGVLLFGRGDLAGAEEAWSRLLHDAMRAGDAEDAAAQSSRAEEIFTAMGAEAWGAALRRRLEGLAANAP